MKRLELLVNAEALLRARTGRRLPAKQGCDRRAIQTVHSRARGRPAWPKTDLSLAVGVSGAARARESLWKVA